jgi:transposase
LFPDVLLPGSAGLELDHLDADLAGIVLTLRSTTSDARCPVCDRSSSRTHARYQRTVADRPWAGIPVRLRLHLRKFVCPNPACPRAIFVERLPTVAAPFAQRSLRLADDQRHLALEHGGEAGARTASRTGMATSPDTLLRLARRTPASAPSTPKVVGIDDWAWRKGQSYGTVVVDLEAHAVIDLLPDRTATTVEAWLKEHPEITIISRDRAGADADGASKGAPQAVQVADRFHLLQNLRETLQRLLDRHHAALRAIHLPPSNLQSVPGTETAAGAPRPDDCRVTETEATAIQSTADQPLVSSEQARAEPAMPVRPPTRADQARHISRERRQARYDAVLALHAAGVSARVIAKQLHLSRVTVTRYLAAGSFPERAARQSRRSILDPFIPFMQERWLAGCDNGMQLWREIREQGYAGSRGLVSRWVAQQRGVLPAAGEEAGGAKRRGRRPREQAPPPEPRSLSARRAAWLLIRRPEALKEDEHDLLKQLIESCSDAAKAYALAQSFTQMVRDRDEGAVDRWLEAVEESGLQELRSFAAGLRRDEAAVRAGLSLPWSQGQVEGQVNRLKLIKRSGYGRANFDLLRQRVLAA